MTEVLRPENAAQVAELEAACDFHSFADAELPFQQEPDPRLDRHRSYHYEIRHRIRCEDVRLIAHVARISFDVRLEGLDRHRPRFCRLRHY